MIIAKKVPISAEIIMDKNIETILIFLMKNEKIAVNVTKAPKIKEITKTNISRKKSLNTTIKDKVVRTKIGIDNAIVKKTLRNRIFLIFIK